MGFYGSNDQTPAGSTLWARRKRQSTPLGMAIMNAVLMGLSARGIPDESAYEFTVSRSLTEAETGGK